LPLSDPIDDEPDCRASLLRRESTGEVPAFLTGTEPSEDDLQDTSTHQLTQRRQSINVSLLHTHTCIQPLSQHYHNVHDIPVDVKETFITRIKKKL